MKLITSLFIAALMFASCAEKSGVPSEPVNPYASSLIPYINRCEPYAFRPGRPATFYGGNFGKYQPGNSVIFDSAVVSTFDSWNDTCITFKFPKLHNNGLVKIKAHSILSKAYQYRVNTERDTFEIARDSAELINTLRRCNLIIVIRSNPRNKIGMDTLFYDYNPYGYEPPALDLGFNYNKRLLDITMFGDPWYVDTTDVGPPCPPKSYFIVGAAPYYKSIPITMVSKDSIIFSKNGYIGILDIWHRGAIKEMHNHGYTCGYDSGGFELHDINGYVSIMFTRK